MRQKLAKVWSHCRPLSAGTFRLFTLTMADYLPDECKGMTEHLSEVKEPASMIKTLLRHARIQIEQAEKAHEHAPRQQVLSEAR